MEAALLNLIFDIATTILTHIVKHLAEDKLQCVVTDLTTTGTLWILNGLIAIVADIERGAVEMTRLLGCIWIILTQLGHIDLRTEHTGDYEAMQRHTFHL